MAPIEIAEVKTRIFTEGKEYVLDAAFWPQCGFEFPPHGGGPANQEVQSAVMGTKGTGVNLVTTVAPTSTSPPSRVLASPIRRRTGELSTVVRGGHVRRAPVAALPPSRSAGTMVVDSGVGPPGLRPPCK